MRYIQSPRPWAVVPIKFILCLIIVGLHLIGFGFVYIITGGMVKFHEPIQDFLNWWWK